jgi:ABC-type sugar transport system permease subunit
MATHAQSRHASVARPPFQGVWRELWRARWGYLFISPFFILYLVFGLYPLIASFVLSFTNWKGQGPLEFVGLANFELLLKDAVFWQSMLNGVILFFLYVPLMTLLALTLAVILNSKRVRGFRFFRTLIFLPYITNMVAAGYTFQMLLNQRYGLFNVVLDVFGVPPVPWLDSVWGARVSLCLLVIWAWLGYNMVLMLAGLQTIPSELNEAAAIDGATPVQIFSQITVPLMRPVILFCVILSTMGSLTCSPSWCRCFPTRMVSAHSTPLSRPSSTSSHRPSAISASAMRRPWPTSSLPSSVC